jgi:GT2 family glycosyltransferase
VASRPTQPPFATFGGGIMLIRMCHARTTGLFDEGLLHGWADDAEFQLRGRLLGFEALHDPRATMLHEDKHHGSSRAFGQTANRYRVLLTTYSWKTLLLLAPSLLTFELALTVASIRLGVGAERWRAVRHVWATRREIMAKRALLQSRRRVGDQALLVGGDFQLPGMVLRSRATSAVLKIAHGLFALNWRAVHRWL